MTGVIVMLWLQGSLSKDQAFELGGFGFDIAKQNCSTIIIVTGNLLTNVQQRFQPGCKILVNGHTTHCTQGYCILQYFLEPAELDEVGAVTISCVRKDCGKDLHSLQYRAVQRVQHHWTFCLHN